MNVRRLDAEIDPRLGPGGQRLGLFTHGRPGRPGERGCRRSDHRRCRHEGRCQRAGGRGFRSGAEEFRRSLYIEVRRSRPLALLRAFDAPVMETNCDRRIASTAAPQALMMMNSDFTLKAANRFAAALEARRRRRIPHAKSPSRLSWPSAAPRRARDWNSPSPSCKCRPTN